MLSYYFFFFALLFCKSADHYQFKSREINVFVAVFKSRYFTYKVVKHNNAL